MLIGNAMIFRGYPLDRAFALMAELGYDALELWPGHLGECCTPGLRRRVSRYVSSLGMRCVRYNAGGEPYFLALQSSSEVDTVLEGLKADIDRAVDFGVSEFMTWEGKVPAGASRGDLYGWVYDATVKILEDTVDYAAERGMTVSIEPHPFTLGMDLRWLAKLCDSLDPERFGVTYDCAHFGVGMPTQYAAAISSLGRRIHHLHLSDSDGVTSELHLPPGEGCLDLEAIVRALEAEGFSGSIMLDLWKYPLPEAGSRAGVAFARQTIERLSARAHR